MNLILLGNKLELPNKEESVEEIINIINENLGDSHYLFSHFVIDGMEIYENYEGYLLENIESIEVIKVEVKTLKEMTEDILITTKEYMQRALPLIRKLGEDFYQIPKEETWKNLGDLFEAIQWLLQSFSSIDQNKQLEEIIPSYESWNEYTQLILKFNEIIPNLQEAVKNQDSILIADVLTYEIEPTLNGMLGKLDSMVPEVVKKNHVN